MPERHLISARAYTKVVLHAVKHCHVPVNGVLIGRVDKNGDLLRIEDAQPLLHGQLGLAPMLEIALMQVEKSLALQSTGGEDAAMQIVGYYHANAQYDNLDVGVAASRIADRIQTNYPDACLLLMDNAMLKPSERNESLALTLWHRPTRRGQWTLKTPDESDDDPPLELENASRTLNRIAVIIAEAETHDDLRSLHDFEDHLNDPGRAWLTQLAPPT